VLALSVLTAWAALGRTEGAERAPGLAGSDPGDAGIDKDTRVLFHDDFDAGTAGERWDSVSGRPYVETETDAKVARGRQSARFVVKRDGLGFGR
jgi:hypothetical protein